jgi:hypothetical protein
MGLGEIGCEAVNRIGLVCCTSNGRAVVNAAVGVSIMRVIVLFQ